ncbi:PREDICTED: osteopetrosis-associated transmembrane protein 1 isoform X2 [Nicrophorus vespilloides]|uniref:Osteopetrosis-associated transmembrane protein 1 isoform X2 n=1 Tax=Nicrophorus vespilloides TaxID=110193 RepID=A0ABM1NCY0_NICVS|nr:PREDICTED: osteopetrosis-associated transmembrane protein 1 isoform X2 [Nicrophorus vespilloides]
MHYSLLLLIMLNAIRRSQTDGNNTSVNCTEYKNNFAAYISNFTECAIVHARPITFCESCVDKYINVLQSYHNLSTFSDEAGICINDYINLDRLQIIDTLYHNSFDLWNRAKCYECFVMINDTITNMPSEETTKFNILLNDTSNCMQATYQDENIMCFTCMDVYLALNEYYISISNINEKIGMCMDIVDLMNNTRSQWSRRCCEYRKRKEYVFLISTGFATFLTLLFYILAKFCTDMRTPEIFQQSRFAESLNQNNAT